jgi:hypothetical protein
MSLTDEDRTWINERLDRVETKILTAFHQWASPLEARMRTHSAAIRAMDLEIEQIDDRLKKNRTSSRFSVGYSDTLRRSDESSGIAGPHQFRQACIPDCTGREAVENSVNRIRL